MNKEQAARRATEAALAHVKAIKGAAAAIKVKDRVTAMAGDHYDAAQHIAGLALHERVQKFLNLVSSKIRKGELDANALDTDKIRALFSDKMSETGAALTMRNALSVAYNAGYKEQGMADKRRGYWLYQTKRDSRVRPSHARWEGLILPKDHPLVHIIFPPNGDNCRCIMTAITGATAARLVKAGAGTMTIPKIETGAGSSVEGIDKGWEGPLEFSPERYAALLLERMRKLNP